MASAFQIPMRGNEGIFGQHVVNDIYMFQIPMRGNETFNDDQRRAITASFKSP